MPRKKGKELFDSPEEIDEKDLRNITFTSHMSYLTNKRMHELFLMRDATAVEAGTTFKREMIMAYGATLETIYKEIESILNDKQREEVLGGFNKYKKMLFKEEATIKECFKMYQVLSLIHRLMNFYLQKFQYFFRIESKPMKGIRNTLMRMGWLDDEISEVDEK